MTEVEAQAHEVAADDNLWPETIEFADHAHSSDDLAGALEFVGHWSNSIKVPTAAPHNSANVTALFEAMEKFPSKYRDPHTDVPDHNVGEVLLADLVLRITGWGSQNGYDVGAALISRGLQLSSADEASEVRTA
jgi:hypothetical protein